MGVFKKVKNWVKNLWERDDFRTGFLEFISAELDRAVRIALAVLREKQFSTGQEFINSLFLRLRYEYAKAPDNWIATLANFVFERLKQQQPDFYRQPPQ